jgi:ribosomal-protein-alanine N-acetyltransferase
MTLRQLDESDAVLISGMHRVCFKQPWDEKAMSTLLGLPGVFGYLAVTAQADPVPQGFVMARLAADEAEILTLLVLPPFRRSGVGRSLLAATAEAALAQKTRKLFLEVAATNTSAISLYTEFGFIQQGRRPRYYQNGVDALLMLLALSPDFLDQ